MILAIDIGNTHIVLGCIENSEIRSITRIVTNPLSTENEYAIKIRQILEFEGIDYKSFEGAIVSSVVPQVTASMESAVKCLTGLRPVIVGAGIKTGLNIRLDDPSEMGADLVAGAVGAIAEYGAPLIILDMGTATTFSVIGPDSSFLVVPSSRGESLHQRLGKQHVAFAARVRGSAKEMYRLQHRGQHEKWCCARKRGSY